MNVFPLFNIPVAKTSRAEPLVLPTILPKDIVPKGMVATEMAPRPSGSSGKAQATDPAPTGNVGAFVTPQSLVSFAGATGVISTLWAFIKALVPSLASSGGGVYVVAGLSFVVGALIYWINMADPNAAPLDARGRLTAMAIALVNTVILFNASRALVGT